MYTCLFLDDFQCSSPSIDFLKKLWAGLNGRACPPHLVSFSWKLLYVIYWMLLVRSFHTMYRISLQEHQLFVLCLVSPCMYVGDARAVVFRTSPGTLDMVQMNLFWLLMLLAAFLEIFLLSLSLSYSYCTCYYTWVALDIRPSSDLYQADFVIGRLQCYSYVYGAHAVQNLTPLWSITRNIDRCCKPVCAFSVVLILRYHCAQSS